MQFLAVSFDLANVIQLATFLIVMGIHWGITKTKLLSLENGVKKLEEQKAGELAVKVEDHRKRLESVEVEQSQLRTTIYNMSGKVEASASKIDLIYDMLKEQREGN